MLRNGDILPQVIHNMLFLQYMNHMDNVMTPTQIDALVKKLKFIVL